MAFTPALPIRLEMLADYNAEEWRRLVTDVLNRSARAHADLGVAMGDDVVDVLGATISRLGQTSRRVVAHVLERQLIDLTTHPVPVNEARLPQVLDILMLLGSSAIPEAYDAIVSILREKHQPMKLRLRAADTLVSCKFRLPKELLDEVQTDAPGPLIGPVLEELRQQDPRRCLEFLRSARLQETDLVYLEYPLRQAVLEVGLPHTVSLFDLTKSLAHEPFQKLLLEILSGAFGEENLVTALEGTDPSAASIPTDPYITRSTFSAEQQGTFEGKVSAALCRAHGLVLMSITAYAESLAPPPLGALRSAVQTNLLAGVRYTFYVDKRNRDQIETYRQCFLDVFEKPLREQFQKLVSVTSYKKDWAGNTVVFYFFGDPHKPQAGYRHLIGLVGSERGLALSAEWEVMSDDVAKTMLAALDLPLKPVVPTDYAQLELQALLRSSPSDLVPTDESGQQKIRHLQIVRVV